MAQGTVKKGFFFYFGLFFLLIFAAFMVCLVIMMFNPGKTILWMKYFTANTNQYIEQTTDGENINYSSIKSIKINCDYAKVYVVANNNERNSANGGGIYIINNAKGFVVAKDAKAFDYSVSLEGGDTLTIDITENNGFLFFSKDVCVVLNGYNKLDLSEVSLTVDATGGSDVVFGEATNVDDKDVLLSKANIKTTNGNIIFGKFFKTETLGGNASFSSNTGKIYSQDGYADFSNVDSLTLETEKGNINFNNKLNVNGKDVIVKNKNGTIYCKELDANKVDVYCSQGNFKFDTLTVADCITFENSVDTIISPIIDIITLDGDLTLDASGVDGNSSPTINITTMKGDVDVLSSRGAVNIKETFGKVYVRSSTEHEDGNMNVNINVSDTNANTVNISTEKGKIVLGFKGKSRGTTTLQSKYGDVVVNFTNKAAFNATAKNYEGTAALAEDKIVTNTKLTEGNKSQFAFGTSPEGSILVLTESKLYYNLQDKVE